LKSPDTLSSHPEGGDPGTRGAGSRDVLGALEWPGGPWAGTRQRRVSVIDCKLVMGSRWKRASSCCSDSSARTDQRKAVAASGIVMAAGE